MHPFMTITYHRGCETFICYVKHLNMVHKGLTRDLFNPTPTFTHELMKPEVMGIHCISVHWNSLIPWVVNYIGGLNTILGFSTLSAASTLHYFMSFHFPSKFEGSLLHIGALLRQHTISVHLPK